MHVGFRPKHTPGWRDKPFALRQDATTSTPPKLPLRLLVNAQGQVVARYEGRLAPEAWDGVADLMP